MTRILILITILLFTKIGLGQTTCECTPPSVAMVNKLLSFGNYNDQVDFLLKACYNWANSTDGKGSNIQELRKCTKKIKNAYNELVSYEIYKLSNDDKNFKAWNIVLFSKNEYFKIKDFIKLKGNRESDELYTYNKIYYYFGTSINRDNVPFYLIRVSK